MKLPKMLVLTLCLVAAAGGSITSARAQDEGASVGIPKDKPVFTVALPEGWRAKNALTGISPALWSADNGINVSFQKAGTLAEDEFGKTRVDNEAKMAALGQKDVKCTQAAGLAETKVADNKTYQTVYTYGAGDDAAMTQVDAFSVDGKEYYLATFRGSPAKMTAGAEAIAGLLASITAAK